jgi:hypothetical protein
MKKMIYTAAVLVAIGGAVQAQQKSSPITIAEGWVQDNSKNKEFNAKETLVKADEVGEIGNGHIIVSEIQLDTEVAKLKDVIEFDTRMYTLNKQGKVQVKDAGVIVTHDKKKTSIVKHVIGGIDAGYQAIAYIPEKESIVTVTLSTYSKDFFDDHYSDFQKVVRSYSKNVQLSPTLSESTLD